jgi:undecaprenyl-diphosphatase
MDSMRSLVLGVVQGLTEFLPISSTAHLRVVPALLGWEDPGAAWSAVVQLGTLCAVLGYFRRDVWAILGGVARDAARGRPLESREARLGWMIAAGTVPIVVAGLLLKHFIEGAARSLYVIAASLIALAFVLFIAERSARHERTVDQIGWRDALVIGCAQALALVPGVSRSGVTLTAALFLGLRREDAARFSFLLSIPAVGAAGVYELLSLVRHGELHADGALTLALGTAAALVSGWAAIAWLLRWLRTRTTLVFVAYRIALGALLFALLARGVLA